jgi:hypothetical protein
MPTVSQVAQPTANQGLRGYGGDCGAVARHFAVARGRRIRTTPDLVASILSAYQLFNRHFFVASGQRWARASEAHFYLAIRNSIERAQT